MRSPLLRLFPILILNVIALGIALPVLPALALALGGDAVDVGLLYAVQSAGQFAMAPVWGWLSDRFGRKRILVVIFGLLAVAELFTAVAPSLELLYLSRLTVGLCAGSIAIASALIADVTESADRSKGMAVVGISFGIGFTIGPAVGAGVSVFAHDGPGLLGAGLPFAVAAALSLLTVFMAGLVLEEPPVDPETRRASRVRLDWAALRRFLGRPEIAAMCGIFFLYTIAVSIMESTFFLYMEGVYGYDERQVGLIFAGMGVLMALSQGGVGRVSAAIGDRAMTILGGVLLAVGLFVAPTLEVLWFLLLFLAISTLGRALIHPGLLSLTSQTAEDPGQTGRVMGVLQSSGSLARIAGPAAGGWVFAHMAPAAPFMIAGAVMALALVGWVAYTRARGVLLTPHDSPSQPS